MGSGGHNEEVVQPARICNVGTVLELQRPVNEKVAVIPECTRSLAHALGIEVDVTCGGEVVGGLDHGGGTMYPGVATPHTIGGAVVATVGGIRDNPGVGGAVVEGVLAEVARLEVDDVRFGAARGGEAHD